jgi:hypothetical protein
MTSSLGTTGWTGGGGEVVVNANAVWGSGEAKPGGEESNSDDTFCVTMVISRNKVSDATFEMVDQKDQQCHDDEHTQEEKVVHQIEKTHFAPKIIP